MSRLPDNLIAYLQQEVERIHHGTVRIEINADKPGRFDVITERRERFAPPTTPPGGAGPS